ncbi:hypothetical protein LCGC14_2950750 [marine sediment metagenome]|uniref:Uncharacterized protein n=1 Tax=marine sediment metagenome TaxID=412755 RepID=A0A0F8XFV5_9ZZZZ
MPTSLAPEMSSEEILMSIPECLIAMGVVSVGVKIENGNLDIMVEL